MREKKVSDASSTWGGKIVEAADLVGDVAHGGRGGDQEGAGGPAVGGGPSAHGFDGGLEQADCCPQGTGDEVELVLDDEIRRPQPGGGADRGCRQLPLGLVASVPTERATGIVTAGITAGVGNVAVALAAAGDVPEQCGGVPLAGEAGELVHGGDDERRCEPVYLLVGRQNRKAVGHVVVALGERALAERV